MLFTLVPAMINVHLKLCMHTRLARAGQGDNIYSNINMIMEKKLTSIEQN